MAADRLGPEAEGTARFAAAPRVERHVGVLEIADEIVLDLEVALVDLADERQLVHVLQHRTLRIVDDHALGVPVAHAVNARERPTVRDFLDREVELVASDEIDGRRLT